MERGLSESPLILTRLLIFVSEQNTSESQVTLYFYVAVGLVFVPATYFIAQEGQRERRRTEL
jgi:hypothetical protein